MDGISKHQMAPHSVPSRKRPSQESKCHASSESGQLPREIASAALGLFFFSPSQQFHILAVAELGMEIGDRAFS